jgi:hypothetical protein
MNFAEMSDYAEAVIYVIDVNELQVMEDLIFAVDENSPVGTKIGFPISEIMFEEDNMNSKLGLPDWQTHRYTIGRGNDGDAFQMDPQTGQIKINTQNGCLQDDDGDRTSCATINFERRPNFHLFIETIDSGITGEDRESTTSLITININDINEAPSFRVKTMEKEEQTSTRRPHIPYDTKVTHPPKNIWCWDEDGDPYRFDIIDPQLGDINDGAELPFIMDEKTGLVTVIGENKLDYETKSSYQFRAKCTDTAPGRTPKATTQIVTINLIDVNENPIMGDFHFVITEDWDGLTPVGKLTSTDVDAGQEHFYSLLSGAHVGDIKNEILAFRILTDGTIYVRHASQGGSELDFENGDYGTTKAIRNKFTLTVQVKDTGKGALIDNSQVEITITNVNEAPYYVVPSTPRQVSNRRTYRTQDRAGYYEREIKENVPYDSVIADIEGAITAQDQDAIDTIESATRGQLNAGTKILGAEQKAFYTIDLSQGTGATMFIIDRNSGILKLASGKALNYEDTPYWIVHVIATDQGMNGKPLSVTVPVRIEVLDKNEAPTINDVALEIGENAQIGDKVGIPLIATDPDRTIIRTELDDLTYTITNWEVGTVPSYKLTWRQTVGTCNPSTCIYTKGAGSPTTQFAIEPSGESAGQITINRGPAPDSVEWLNENEARTPRTHAHPITGAGARIGCQGCQILVTASSGNPCIDFDTAGNQFPAPFANNADGSLQLPRTCVPGSADNKCDYSSYGSRTQGCSCEAMYKRPDGKCKTNDYINNEIAPFHRVTVRVTDNGNERNSGTALLWDECTADIKILYENKPPVLKDTSRKMLEDGVKGTNAVGSAIVATDEDGDKMLYEIIGGNLDDRFDINKETGIVSINKEKMWGEWSLDFEKRNVYPLRVKATDIPRKGDPMVDTALVTIFLVDINENPVVNDGIRDVDENSTPGTEVGEASPVPAADEDAGDSVTAPLDGLTWSIFGDGNQVTFADGSTTYGVFAIDAKTGQITVAKKVLDYEWKAQYHIDIRVTDLGGLSDECVYNIRLRDTNDRPILVKMFRNINENSLAGALVGTSIMGFDQDSLDVLSYRLKGDNCWGVEATPTMGEVYTSLPLEFVTPKKNTQTNKVLDDVKVIKVKITGGKFENTAASAPEFNLGKAFIVLSTGKLSSSTKFTGHKVEFDTTTGRIVIHECSDVYGCTIVQEETPQIMNVLDARRQYGTHDWWIKSKQDGLTVTITVGSGAGPTNNNDKGVIQSRPLHYVKTLFIAGGSATGSVAEFSSICYKGVLSSKARQPVDKSGTVMTGVPADAGTMIVMDSLTGQLSLSPQFPQGFLDFETLPNHLSIEVEVSDNYGLKYTSCVEVLLNDLNEKPLITTVCGYGNKNIPGDKYSACPHVDENTLTIKKDKNSKSEAQYIIKTFEQDVGDDHEWIIEGGNKGDTFAIGRSGTNAAALTVTKTTWNGFAMLNYEDSTFSSYLLSIRVTETVNRGVGSLAKKLTDVGDLWITIDDVNEPPVLRDAIFDIHESKRGSDKILVGTRMSKYASDIDDFGQHKLEWGHASLTYSLETTCADCIKTMFKIDPKTGQLRLSDETSSGIGSGFKNMDIGTVDEPWGQVMHAPVYKERGAAGKWRALDFEVKKSYNIIVRATDGPAPNNVGAAAAHKANSQGIHDTAVVTVHIKDVNENPIMDDLLCMLMKILRRTGQLMAKLLHLIQILKLRMH